MSSRSCGILSVRFGTRKPSRRCRTVRTFSRARRLRTPLQVRYTAGNGQGTILRARDRTEMSSCRAQWDLSPDPVPASGEAAPGGFGIPPERPRRGTPSRMLAVQAVWGRTVPRPVPEAHQVRSGAAGWAFVCCLWHTTTVVAFGVPSYSPLAVVGLPQLCHEY